MPKTPTKKKMLSKLQAAFFPEVNEIAGVKTTRKAAKKEKIDREKLAKKEELSRNRAIKKAEKKSDLADAARKEAEIRVAKYQAKERIILDLLNDVVIEREVEAENVDDAQQKAQEEK